ncbi:hypothetical protein Cadr_000008085 [Camelus dromedarius]|uniref:Uncharacterized protein n=1 Tax=Camelus dromedarius TaxID=9838 RepID=A0A5N4DY57_CAMDR|nr:hypothetical protein Cadr_000008085 [Camelus dromedarius]
MTYFEIVSYESENGIWIECNVYENASLTLTFERNKFSTLTWILILIENGIQSVWKPLMDYEILTCSPILHEQEFPLEILTESETPNKEDSITNGTGHIDA